MNHYDNWYHNRILNMVCVGVSIEFKAMTMLSKFLDDGYSIDKVEIDVQP